MTVQQACYTIRGAAHEQRGFADQVIDPPKIKERFLKNAADLDAAAKVLEESILREVALRAEVEYLTTQGAALKKCLEGRNRDASVLRKLHEEQLAPAINFEMIQAEDAADVLIAESTQF